VTQQIIYSSVGVGVYTPEVHHRMTDTSPTPEQLGQLSAEVAKYIMTQRDKYRPAGRPLSSEQRITMGRAARSARLPGSDENKQRSVHRRRNPNSGDYAGWTGRNGLAFTTRVGAPWDFRPVGPGQFYVISGNFVNPSGSASGSSVVAPTSSVHRTWSWPNSSLCRPRLGAAKP
jgi:hypothetical protein